MLNDERDFFVFNLFFWKKNLWVLFEFLMNVWSDDEDEKGRWREENKKQLVLGDAQSSRPLKKIKGPKINFF